MGIKSRESQSSISPQAEAFFPPATPAKALPSHSGASSDNPAQVRPPQTAKNNAASLTTTATPSLSNPEANPSSAKVEPSELKDPKDSAKVTDPALAKPATASPTKKKKSSYVPPSPITATPVASNKVESAQITNSKGALASIDIPPLVSDSVGSKSAKATASASSNSNTKLPDSHTKGGSAEVAGFEEDNNSIGSAEFLPAPSDRRTRSGDASGFHSYEPEDLLPEGEDVNNKNAGDYDDEDKMNETTSRSISAGAKAGAGALHRHGKDATPEPSSASGMRFDELYRLKGVLGTGAFSTVREGFHRNEPTTSFAVKCINRKKLSEEDEAALLDEVAILKEMKHVHIIRLYDFFEEPSTYYLVMERMRGGELFDRIVAKAYYNEKEARDTCKIVLEAVRYCHENHVAHRDLKPENLLLVAEDDDSSVKIADFGFAKKVFTPSSLTTQCGTPGYVAPEILEGTPYDERADMWSVGVILYILLGGYPPFIESTQRDLFRKIRKGEYEFHEEYWGTVSAEAKELISSLLTVDPNNRLTAEDALENAWILGDDAKLAEKDLGANLDKLRNFNAKRKFRAAVSTVMAVNKLNSLTEFLKTLKE